MAIAAIYDIHGHLPALQAVLQEIRAAAERGEVDEILVGGDVVLGPFPSRTLDQLLNCELPTRFVMGNTDREVLAQANGEVTEWFRNSPAQWTEPVAWVAGQLTDSQLASIAAWPPTVRANSAGLGRILFCHATPRNDTDIILKTTAEAKLLPLFEQAEADVVVCGHTHMPFERMVGRTRVVNAGSVGMPFGRPGAAWLLVGPEISPQHTTYDLTAVAAEISATRYPDAANFAQQFVVNPPSEESMLALFAKSEVSEL